MSVADDIARLDDLRRQGALSEEEYARAKEQVLRGVPPLRDLAAETRQWALFLHVSQLLGLVIPVAGWLAPILIWQLKKEEMPGLDAHGRNAANWMISELIYAIVAGVLCLFCIGIPLLIAVALAGIVLPIIAGVKASDGEVWPYPCAIRFFR
jgi:uncharacterized Tic20 family protein